MSKKEVLKTNLNEIYDNLSKKLIETLSKQNENVTPGNTPGETPTPTPNPNCRPSANRK